MKKVLLASVAFLFLAIAVRAQDTAAVEVSAGYSMIEVGKGYTFMMHGGSASVAFNLNDWLGIVGDFGGYYAHPGKFSSAVCMIRR